MDSEDQVLAGLTALVEQSNPQPAPRDDRGRFAGNEPAQPEQAQAPEQQEQETTAETEQPAEQASAETDVIEIDPDEPLFDHELDVDGKKEVKKLSLREYQQGYLRQQDYTRKTQEVARQRAEVQEQARQAKVEATKEYAQKLDVIQAALVKVAAPELGTVDWDKLANEDPAEFVRLSNRATKLNQVLSAIETEKSAAAKRAEEEEQKKHTETWQRSLEVLQRDIPEWGTPLVEKLVTTGKNVYGVDPAQWRDAGMIKMLHDAMRYRDGQAKAPVTAKKIALAPKVLKPGAKQPVNPSRSVFDAVRKTGKAEDALPFFEQILRK